MTTILTTGQDNETAWGYLAEARKHHTQMHIAQSLGVDIRTVRRWEAKQTPIKSYVIHVLQRSCLLIRLCLQVRALLLLICLLA